MQTIICYSQQKFIKIELNTGQRSSIELSSIDTLIQEAHTNYNLGFYDDNFTELDEEIPTQNIFPNTQFTLKQPVDELYDKNTFPIRTSVRLFRMINDTLKGTCSGSMISNKHVLTATHCFAKLNKDTLRSDSIFVCPVYDQGIASDQFECSWVKNVFFTENWNVSYNDLGVMELETPIGLKTGWIGVGFNKNQEELQDGIFYKFSYPAKNLFHLDTNQYNGDTLYVGYGKSDYLANNWIGIKGTFGIPGESGSNLIKIKNESFYVSYGVLTYSPKLLHTIINQQRFNQVNQIIQNDLILNVPSQNTPDKIHIYPNPAIEYLIIETTDLLKVKIFNILGQKVIETEQQTTIDVSNLLVGEYILFLETEKTTQIVKFVKTDN